MGPFRAARCRKGCSNFIDDKIISYNVSELKKEKGKEGIFIGSIRPTYIKSVSQELLRRHVETFSSDYEKNKLLVSEYTNIESKNIRNRVAGYITHRVEIGNRRKS
ncbi:MAG TPA: 30S ribosomal protein S17e [archaeon]